MDVNADSCHVGASQVYLKENKFKGMKAELSRFFVCSVYLTKKSLLMIISDKSETLGKT